MEFLIFIKFTVYTIWFFINNVLISEVFIFLVWTIFANHWLSFLKYLHTFFNMILRLVRSFWAYQNILLFIWLFLFRSASFWLFLFNIQWFHQARNHLSFGHWIHNTNLLKFLYDLIIIMFTINGFFVRRFTRYFQDVFQRFFRFEIELLLYCSFIGFYWSFWSILPIQLLFSNKLFIYCQSFIFWMFRIGRPWRNIDILLYLYDLLRIIFGRLFLIS